MTQDGTVVSVSEMETRMTSFSCLGHQWFPRPIWSAHSSGRLGRDVHSIGAATCYPVGLIGASVGGGAFVGKDVGREGGCGPLTDFISVYQAHCSIKIVFVPCVYECV